MVNGNFATLRRIGRRINIFKGRVKKRKKTEKNKAGFF